MSLTHTQNNHRGMIVPQKTGAIAPKGLMRYTHSHLQFSLGKHLALLPTHQILEAITIPATSMTPMPNMPPAMLGLINRRSQVLWVADLALLLGIPVAYPNSQQYNLVILQVNQILVGLRVQEIVSIFNLPLDQIRATPANVSPNLLPFLRGCFLQGQEVLLVLNAEAILRAPALQPN